MYDSWGHDKTLDVYRKMTPGRSGKWKDMEAVVDANDADYHIIIDYTTKHQFDPKKAIYISAHPVGYPGHHDPVDCLARIDYRTDSGFLEWWLKYDYDELSQFAIPNKTRDIACIMTSTSCVDYQIDRLTYMEGVVGVDMYGRQTNPLIDGEGHWGGKEIIADYKYTLEFDAYCKNYFSERVADSILMYCMPFYKGGTNVEAYLPKESFAYIEPTTPQELVNRILNTKIDYKAIEEARYLILNKLQLWAKVYDKIQTLC